MSTGFYSYYRDNQKNRETVETIIFKLYKEIGTYYGVAKFLRDFDPEGKGVSITHIKRILSGSRGRFYKRTKRRVHKSFNPWIKN